MITGLVILIGLLTRALAADAEQDEPRVVIPFDFESQFDEGRYGRMVGDLIWKKLEREGGFIIPESMLDVRDWQQRRRVVPNPGTPLEVMRDYVTQDFGAHVGIWGKIERVPGNEFDVYDLWLNVADFSGPEPRLVYQNQVRTKTVSEIPHVYVKEALAKLYGRGPDEPAPPDPDAERRWRTGRNLVQGDFERGTDRPTGWDPLPQYVSRVRTRSEQGQPTRVIRFQFPGNVAATTGVLYYSEFFPVDAYATYRFQCRWRTTGSAVKVFIKCYDEIATEYDQRDGQTVKREKREVYRSQQNLSGPSMTWNVQTEDFTPQHTQFTPQWGRVMLYAYYPAGTVDFDDVIVKQIKPPPTQQTPRARRPSLETKVLSEEIEKASRQK
jgi:hypothetical protein